jgi:thiol-disulfide isomerase/thioredoxin
MSRYILSISFAIAFSVKTASQALSVGDKCPELVFENMINARYKSATLSEFKNKMVLLDFSATSCIPCLELLPVLDSLQKKYANDVQVIMVSSESRERLTSFLEINKIGKSCHIPIVVEDSVLAALFPHTALPHEVWIDRQGYVAAITGHEYVTSENIHKIVNGQRVSWPVKADLEFDKDSSILGMSKNNYKYYYTAITPFKAGYRSHGSTCKIAGNTLQVKYINYTLLDLYLLAVQKNRYSFYQKQIKVDASLIHRFFYDSTAGYYAAWRQNNSICYESVFPSSQPLATQRSKMQSDLDFYLGIQSVFVKQKQACLVLKDNKSPGTTNPVAKNGISIAKAMSLINNKVKLPFFMNGSKLKDRELQKIFINITEENASDIEVLRKELQKLGFSLVEEEKDIETLVIQDQKRKRE